MFSTERQGQRVYLLGDTYPVKDRIKAVGGTWDGGRRAWWFGAAKAAEAEALAKELNGGPTAAKSAKQNPSEIRLTGKGEYKGRAYYLGTHSDDGTRVRCLTLPDDNGNYLDFWADVSAVRVVRIYDIHFSGRYGKRYLSANHPTLGGVADFVRRRRKNRTAGGGVCAECGKGGELVQDLEDGSMKHRSCCDIEP